jgi:hypothetical protein
MIMRRVPYVVILVYFLAIGSSCETDERETTYHYAGFVYDNVTGNPIPDMEIYACTGTHFGNAAIRIAEKILKGRTDHCGYYSISIPEAEAGYSEHQTAAETPVMLFSHHLYGEHIYRAGQSNDKDYSFRTPFLDTLRWSFDQAGTTLRIDIRSNDIPYVKYIPSRPSQEIQIANGTIHIIQRTPTGSYEYLETFEDVTPASSISFYLSDVEISASLDITVAAGDPSRSGVFKFVIPSGDRRAVPYYVLPVAASDNCD